MDNFKTNELALRQRGRLLELIAALTLSVSILGGCAVNAPAGNGAQFNLEAVTSEVDAELAKGRRENAIALLNDAAKEHPTSVIPWLKMANIWFEAENYPSTILAATEVLQRDAANQEAKSLLVVAGLRVSAGAVAGLRPSGPAGTSTRVEAEKLTNSLREALGETVLVPTPAVAESRSAPRASRSRARLRAAVRVRESESANASAGAMSDPFKSLK